jgi:hypothetical protein
VKNGMNVKYKKSLKIATLLITSIIIATVSAASYSELFMTGSTIRIGTPSVIFTSGSNTSEITGGDVIPAPYTTVTFDNITNIQPGETRTYEQAVNITNNAVTTKTINMSFVSLTGQFESNFDYLNITMIDASGASKGDSIQIVSSGLNVTRTGNQQMSAGEVWAVRWIIKAKSGATDGESITLTLKVRVD